MATKKEDTPAIVSDSNKAPTNFAAPKADPKPATEATPSNWTHVDALDNGSNKAMATQIRKGVILSVGGALTFIPNAKIEDRGNGATIV